MSLSSLSQMSILFSLLLIIGFHCLYLDNLFLLVMTNAIGRQKGTIVCIPTLINRLFDKESIAVEKLFVGYIMWN